MSAPPVLDASSTFQYPGGKRSGFSDPVHEEIVGDVFDRQRVMAGWDQGKVEEQVVFVLGAGGLGQSVAMAVCRMGVRKVFVLDRDVYDATNLTRQILGGLADVGQRKVAVSIKHLQMHNLRSELVPMDMDAVLNWPAVVEAARQCTVVFNCIDYGGMFDYAINSLCKSLRIPLITGSSYAWSMQSEYYSGAAGKKCSACAMPPHDYFVPTSASREKESLPAFVEWLKSKDASQTEFSAAQLTAYLRFKLNMAGVEEDVLLGFERAGASAEGVLPAAAFTTVMSQVRDCGLSRLSLARIASNANIAFIPQEPHFPTRQVGSWVCVCVGAALQMVNMWVQELMTGADTANSLFVSCTDYSMFTDRPGSGDSDAACAICAEAMASAGK